MFLVCRQWTVVKVCDCERNRDRLENNSCLLPLMCSLNLHKNKSKHIFVFVFAFRIPRLKCCGFWITKAVIYWFKQIWHKGSRLFETGVYISYETTAQKILFFNACIKMKPPRYSSVCFLLQQKLITAKELVENSSSLLSFTLIDCYFLQMSMNSLCYY